MLFFGFAVAAAALVTLVQRHERARPHGDIDEASRRELERILERADRGEAPKR